MKVNHMVSPLENPKQITFARKTVARISTELRYRELIEAQNQDRNEKPKKRKNWCCDK